MRKTMRVVITLLTTTLISSVATAYPNIPQEFFTKMIGGWASDQRLIVRSAANKAAKRMFQENILSCAKKVAGKDLPKDVFWSRVNRIKYETVRVDVQVGQLGLECPQYGPVVTGRAPVNRYTETRTSDGHQMEFSIKLNENCIGNNSLRYSAKNSDFWAGVIAHEIGHNLGLVHSNGYGGSFIREWEKCIENQGEWSGSKGNPGFIDSNKMQEVY